MLQAVAAHIAATSYQGKTYTSAFLGFDLRHYGNFGEGWGEGVTPPSGAQVTDAYLITMTDAAIAVFPNVQLSIALNYVAPNNDYDNADGNPGTQAAYHAPQPTATAQSDTFALPAQVTAGTYGMYLVIRDPASYKQPLPLAISGRGSDGSYLLRDGIVVTH